MRLPSWSRFVPVVLLLALAAVSVAQLAWGFTFTTWQDYDDQGYFMLATRHVLDGHAPYDEVPFLHGPAYFLWRWLLHSVGGIPLTFDAVRIITVGVWTAVALCGAAWVWQSTSRWTRLACTLTAVCMGGGFLVSLAGEPGHSQEPILLVCASIIAFAPRLMRGRAERAAIALGLAAGVLIGIKVNVGLLFAVGVLGHFLARLELRVGSNWVRGVWFVALAALPVVIMRADLDREWAFGACATTALSLIAMSLSTRPAAAPTSVRTLVICALSTIAGVAISVSFALLRGSTVGEIVRCTIIDPLRLPRIYSLFPGFLSGAAPLAAISLTLVVAIRFLPERVARVAASWISFAARLALLAAWIDRTTHGAFTLVSFGPALLPLALLPLGSTRERIEPSRHLLAWMAASATLQTYPVAGTQTVIASFPAVPLMIVLLAELVEKVLHADRSVARGRVAMGATLLAGASFVVPAMRVNWDAYYTGWHLNRWHLDLPGTRLLVLFPGPTLRFRWMARNLEVLSSRFVAAMSTNCLHFWTTQEPLTLDVVTHVWQLVPRERQRLLIEALERERAPFIAMRSGLLYDPGQNEEPFIVHVREHYRVLAQFEGFQLYVRRETPPIDLLDCAWSPAPDEIERLPERVQRETEGGRAVLVVSTPLEIAGREIAVVRFKSLTTGLTLLATDIGTVDGRLRIFDGQGHRLLGGAAPNTPTALGTRVYLSMPRDSAQQPATSGVQVGFYAADSDDAIRCIPIVDRPPPQ